MNKQIYIYLFCCLQMFSLSAAQGRNISTSSSTRRPIDYSAYAENVDALYPELAQGFKILGYNFKETLKGNGYFQDYTPSQTNMRCNPDQTDVIQKSIKIIKYVEIEINRAIKAKEITLLKAVQHNSYELAKMLCDQSENLNINEKDQSEQNALFHSISLKNFEMIQLLLDHNIDINLSNINGVTPLCLAVDKNNINICKLLLNRKDIDINSKDQFEQNVLFEAFRLNNLEIIQLLLDNNIDVNARNINGITPLELAVEKKQNINICKLLLNRKDIDINSKDQFGQNVLFDAFRLNNLEIIQLLLDNNIDVNARNINGVTPLDFAIKIATETKDFKICHLLRDHKNTKPPFRILIKFPFMNPTVSNYDKKIDDNEKINLKRFFYASLTSSAICIATTMFLKYKIKSVKSPCLQKSLTKISDYASTGAFISLACSLFAAKPLYTTKNKPGDKKSESFNF